LWGLVIIVILTFLYFIVRKMMGNNK
jgi:hypothetical protein